MSIHVLIMAGGNGTRFWPVSTPEKPKQYTCLSSDDSLIQESIKRSLKFSRAENIYVVTVEGQKQIASLQTKGMIPSENIIIEPEGRNTAPCIFLGLLQMLKNGVSKDDCIVVLPSDHVINNQENFSRDIQVASENAKKRQTITVIGIPPTSPHTGYGYIQKGESIDSELYKVSKFVEKPNSEIAEKYLASGEYFWNAGMFISTISTLLGEISTHSQDLGAFKEELFNALGSPALVSKVYNKLPKDSFDYAVIEKSQRVDALSSSFDWSDLGSWDALEDITEASEDNFICSAENTQFLDSAGNIIYAPGKKVSLINCKDLVVVVNEGHVMVLPKSEAQKVKQLNQKI